MTLGKKLKPHSSSVRLIDAGAHKSYLKLCLYQRYSACRPFVLELKEQAIKSKSFCLIGCAIHEDNEEPRQQCLKELAIFCKKWGLLQPDDLKDVCRSIRWWHSSAFSETQGVGSFIDGKFMVVKQPEYPELIYVPELRCELPDYQLVKTFDIQQSFRWDYSDGLTLNESKQSIMRLLEDEVDKQLANIAFESRKLDIVEYREREEISQHLDWFFRKVALRQSWREISLLSRYSLSTIRTAVSKLANILDIQLPQAKSGRPNNGKELTS